MNWHEVGALAEAGTLLVTILFFVMRSLRRIRTNDLHHIAAGVTRIEEKIDGVEKKIDDHIIAHAEGRFRE
jgi:hypothetical protein